MITFEKIADNLTSDLSRLIPLLFLVATIVFLWGVIIYITAGGAEDKIKKGRAFILWGLVGLFVMVAVWGIVNLFVKTIFPEGLPKSPTLPSLPGSKSTTESTVDTITDFDPDEEP